MLSDMEATIKSDLDESFAQEEEQSQEGMYIQDTAMQVASEAQASALSAEERE